MWNDERPEVEPPPKVYDAIVRELRSDGSIRTGRNWVRILTAAAVLAGVFAAGWTAARATMSEPVRGDRYMLLLYGEVSGTERDLVSEYAAWARAARTNGRFMTGERLDRKALVLGGEAASVGPAAAGYFLFTAPTSAEAEALARSHPHLRHGGRIVLRRINPT
jgi:hypothetical protein